MVVCGRSLLYPSIEHGVVLAVTLEPAWRCRLIPLSDEAPGERAKAVRGVAEEFNSVFNDSFRAEIDGDEEDDDVSRVGWRACTYHSETLTQVCLGARITLMAMRIVLLWCGMEGMLFFFSSSIAGIPVADESFLEEQYFGTIDVVEEDRYHVVYGASIA